MFVTTDHMGEPMPLNMVVQNLQVTLTEYNVKMSEQSKVQRVAPTAWFYSAPVFTMAKMNPHYSSSNWFVPQELVRGVKWCVEYQNKLSELIGVSPI